ncbi:hypothetical protein TELCIR_21290 [Teladorsagia circumcincta]|uniref:Uncharacterized protein n=1 Tax=Teladorsagia circumcincta TaxID=45464 RepID=A0A2G9TH56_TELCI|nr:hypothetical protein TELCIR_21290 [Teladorsagia circumcincta]
MVSAIGLKVKDALKSAEQVTVMPEVINEDYVKVAITAFGSNSCDQGNNGLPSLNAINLPLFDAIVDVQSTENFGSSDAKKEIMGM